MSNDIILKLQNSVAAIQPGIDEDTRAVAGNSGNKRISIDGGVFRKFVGGKEVAAIEDRHMLLVFVRMAHNPSRTFYKDAYRKGVKVSPTCWSNDAKTPDPAVKNPPAVSCDSCPFSVKGSGQGGTGTACRLSWRTAVVIPGDPGGDVMQLVLPATSCFGNEEGGKWPFRPYIQMLANNNISASRVITKAQFDTKASVPRLLFSPVGAVEANDVEVIARQAQSEHAAKAITLTVYQTDTPESAVEVAQPIDEVEEVPEVAAPVEQEPRMRETPKAAETSDAASVISKWKSKKKD
jgi:hypothetical protein